MIQAASSLVEAEPPPDGPIRGLHYQWNPGTHQLYRPDDPHFDSLDLFLITGSSVSR